MNPLPPEHEKLMALQDDEHRARLAEEQSRPKLNRHQRRAIFARIKQDEKRANHSSGSPK